MTKTTNVLKRRATLLKKDLVNI